VNNYQIKRRVLKEMSNHTEGEFIQMIITRIAPQKADKNALIDKLFTQYGLIKSDITTEIRQKLQRYIDFILDFVAI
jgi:hypothetical protein